MITRHLLNNIDSFDFLFVIGFLLCMVVAIYVIDFLYQKIKKFRKVQSLKNGHT